MAKVRKKLDSFDSEQWSDADFIIPPASHKESSAIVYEIDEDFNLIFKADSMVIFLQRYTNDWSSDIMPDWNDVADSSRIEITVEGPNTRWEQEDIWKLAYARIADSKCPAEVQAAIFNSQTRHNRVQSVPKHDSKPFSKETYEIFWSEWYGESAQNE